MRQKGSLVIFGEWCDGLSGVCFVDYLRPFLSEMVLSYRAINMEISGHQTDYYYTFLVNLHLRQGVAKLVPAWPSLVHN